MKLLAAFALVTLSSCATPRTGIGADFFDSLSALCGKAYEGQIVSPEVAADASFADKRLVMHVRECSSDEIRIPFHVGDDHSRTWVITRTVSGLRLKHDHRHEDGSEDAVTQYGGDSTTPAASTRQTFPADAFTKQLLVRQNNPAGVNNIWAIEVEAGRAFAYELRRPGRFFRVEFDLARPVALPPAPWGAR